jgi:hypothetical protein
VLFDPEFTQAYMSKVRLLRVLTTVVQLCCCGCEKGLQESSCVADTKMAGMLEVVFDWSSLRRV